MINNNLSIFDLLFDEYKITKSLKVIELFAGYGSQALALKYLGVPFEHHFVCEFDKYAMQTYNEIHNTNFTTSDIKNISAKDLNIVDRDKYEYIMTYSFPCTDLSLAGKRAGMEKGSGTRSGLLWEVERLLTELNGNLPQVLLMENVPQVISANGWKEWNYFLESLGYKNYCEILNAKDYGIPQNRQRAFMISILGDYSYTFPKPIELKLRLKDMLESNVDEKYYLSDKMIKYISKTWTENYKNCDCKINCSIARPLTTDQNKRAGTTNYICDEAPENYDLRGINNKNLIETLKTNEIGANDFIDSYNKTVRKDGIIGTITTGVDSRNCTFIAVPEATKKGYAIAEEGDGVYINRPHQKRGVVQKGMIQTIKTSPDDIGVVVKKNDQMTKKIQNLRIRKLTCRECFRLMGVKDEQIDKITCSNAQKYKQAGNSIVVNVLMAIFKQLF